MSGIIASALEIPSSITRMWIGSVQGVQRGPVRGDYVGEEETEGGILDSGSAVVPWHEGYEEVTSPSGMASEAGELAKAGT